MRICIHSDAHAMNVVPWIHRSSSFSDYCRPASPRPTKAAHLPPNGNGVPAESKESSGSPRTYSSLLATRLCIGKSRDVTRSVCCWWWTKTQEILEIANLIPSSNVHGHLAAQDWNALEEMEGNLSNQILGWTKRVARKTEPFEKCDFSLRWLLL